MDMDYWQQVHWTGYPMQGRDELREAPPPVRTESLQRGIRRLPGRMTWASLTLLYPCSLRPKQAAKQICRNISGPVCLARIIHEERE